MATLMSYRRMNVKTLQTQCFNRNVYEKRFTRMAMNKFMHPRNIYNTPADFAKLAEEYEEFRAIAKKNDKGKVHIDFKDETALKTLTTCLLKRDFNLTVHLPPKQLVPTLPLRLNYILWIEDIVNTFKFDNVIGLDIGCGASCIYPLLAVRTNPNWRMFGIELNEESVKYARDNVNQNGLAKCIEILDCTSKDDPLDALDGKEWKRFDFTMCNPPFFNDDHDSDDDDTAKETNKRKPANNAKTGISCELTTTGGEVEFVKKIVQRSREFKKLINVFTTMLGHKTSLQPILQELKNQGITNYCTSEFCQGWTKRWGIAWTFRNDLLLRTVPTIGQTQPKQPHRFLPDDVDDPDIATKKLYRILGELSDTKITNQEKIESGSRFQFIAITDSWKNQRRKRRQQARAQQNPDIEVKPEAEGSTQVERKGSITDETEKSTSSKEIDETDSQPAKRIKLEVTAVEDRVMQVINSIDSPPLLHIEVSVQSKTLNDLKAIVEVKLTYLNGTSKLDGVYELLQFIQNKWSQKTN